MASRSGSEEKKPRRKQQTYKSESEGEESEDYQPRQRSQRRRNQRQQRGGQGGPLDNLALDNVQNTAGGLVNSATGALGGVAGNAVQQQQGGGDKGKSDTLRLRLDLNLDIEITLKAKIHGDLELALLYVTISPLLASIFLFSFPPFTVFPERSACRETSCLTYRRGSSVYSTSVSPPAPSPPLSCSPRDFSFFLSSLLPRLKVDAEKPEQETLSSPWRHSCTPFRPAPEREGLLLVFTVVTVALGGLRIVDGYRG